MWINELKEMKVLVLLDKTGIFEKRGDLAMEKRIVVPLHMFIYSLAPWDITLSLSLSRVDNNTYIKCICAYHFY